MGNFKVEQQITSSWSSRAVLADTATTLLGSVESASYCATASLLLGSIESASYADNALSASHAATASLILGFIESASFATTASYAATVSGGIRIFANQVDVGDGALVKDYFGSNDFGYIDGNDTYLAGYIGDTNTYTYGGGFINFLANTNKVQIQYPTLITGSLNVSTQVKADGFTGSLLGTANDSLFLGGYGAATWINDFDTSSMLNNRLRAVQHGSNANYPRPNALVVYWIGTVDPLSASNADMWFSGSV